jgi:hypothetical protein
MTLSNRPGLRVALAAAAGILCLAWSGDLPVVGSGSMMSEAEARVGRPATPVSYAGVARRTTRRTVAVGTAVAPRPVYVAPAPVVVTPTCVQVVDAYGRVSYRCP